MSATVTFFGQGMVFIGSYTVADDNSVVTSIDTSSWVTAPIAFSVKVNPESGNDMVKQRIQVLENKFRRFTQDITDSIDRLDMG